MTATADERIYPCDRCGVMRSKAEGGTVFTVCDACWEGDEAEAREICTRLTRAGRRNSHEDHREVAEVLARARAQGRGTMGVYHAHPTVGAPDFLQVFHGDKWIGVAVLQRDELTQAREQCS